MEMLSSKDACKLTLQSIIQDDDGFEDEIEFVKQHIILAAADGKTSTEVCVSNQRIATVSAVLCTAGFVVSPCRPNKELADSFIILVDWSNDMKATIEIK